MSGIYMPLSGQDLPGRGVKIPLNHQTFHPQTQTLIPEHVRVVEGVPKVQGLHVEPSGHVTGGLVVLPVRI